MHELSVALALVELASEALADRGRRVSAVHLRVGALSGVDPDALRFSFDMAAAGSELEGAQLRIVDVPVTAWCAGCDAERAVVSISCRRCAVCRAVAPRIVRGEELELVGLEIDDDDHQADRSSTASAEQE
ncbi:MAG TPA: hydrogenase maturation nickel metallochaperone HypA [Vicinamibacterales bacterium]|nr:hydrogenase maturation nickel metallochaperone HypA [Vicinamibacterales bacterium]